jgi:hypothetical protein
MAIFQLNSYVNTFMNMSADIFVQKNVQSESGAMTRQWIYDQTIHCKVMPVQDKGGSGASDNKKYSPGSAGYIEDIHVKMQSPIRLSKRWRIGNVVAADGERVFIEPDKLDLEDTIFDVVSTHPVLDPFGHIAYYEVNLRRAQVQNNDIITV